MNKKLNPYRHFYLYAKNHYRKSDDIVEDLKKIQKDYCGCTSHIRDIILILHSEVYKHIKFEGHFLDFLNDIHPENVWRVGYDYGVKDEKTGIIKRDIVLYDFHLAVIYKFLSILMLSETSNIEGSLGEADPKILPLSEVTKERIEREKKEAKK